MSKTTKPCSICGNRQATPFAFSWTVDGNPNLMQTMISKVCGVCRKENGEDDKRIASAILEAQMAKNDNLLHLLDGNPVNVELADEQDISPQALIDAALDRCIGMTVRDFYQMVENVMAERMGWNHSPEITIPAFSMPIDE